ncbi:hypothetical protein BD777DRAFT_132512 [Yarrowia lipolytica]|nr:hypothetical protein BD777DRAFT_132512 [Yarrowia lipolytica]
METAAFIFSHGIEMLKKGKSRSVIAEVPSMSLSRTIVVYDEYCLPDMLHLLTHVTCVLLGALLPRDECLTLENASLHGGHHLGSCHSRKSSTLAISAFKSHVKPCSLIGEESDRQQTLGNGGDNSENVEHDAGSHNVPLTSPKIEQQMEPGGMDV